MKKRLLLLSLSLLLTLSSCRTTPTESSKKEEPNTSSASEGAAVAKTPSVKASDSAEESNQLEQSLPPYSDVRGNPWDSGLHIYKESDYRAEEMITFTFNEENVFEGNEDLQKQIMENGKNPGLGVRALHQRGITGKGVTVAIIDQNLLLDHPEFDGKITEYYDTGTEKSPREGSMHGPAVTSLLAGETIGVAPEVQIYYAAAPSWKGDSHFYADALLWIIEKNKPLPAGEKIRVVSVSAAPSGTGSPFTKNLEEWDEAVSAAQAEGILVLDCREDNTTGIISSAFYDPANPEDVSLCKTGFPSDSWTISPNTIGAPASYRTVAEEYEQDAPSYQYNGEGGLSWAIPYASGVLAMGWQVNPNLSNDEIIKILFETCFVNDKGSKIINPPAFIEAIEKTV